MLHKVDSIENAFARRVQYLHDYIKGEVNTKREAIMAHIESIKRRASEIEETSKVIKKDIQVELQGVDSRLRAA